METSPCCNSVAGHQIATNFCTCHDSTAVVPCTKFCSYHCIRIEMRVKRNFHRIWIAMKKPLVKRGPVRNCWKATVCCEKSKFTISSTWLEKGSVSHQDNMITLSQFIWMRYQPHLSHLDEIRWKVMSSGYHNEIAVTHQGPVSI